MDLEKILATSFIFSFLIISEVLHTNSVRLNKEIKQNFEEVYKRISIATKTTNPFTNSELYHELREASKYLDTLAEMKRYPSKRSWLYLNSLIIENKL